jgi:hypothetical protein
VLTLVHCCGVQVYAAQIEATVPGSVDFSVVQALYAGAEQAFTRAIEMQPNHIAAWNQV